MFERGVVDHTALIDSRRRTASINDSDDVSLRTLLSIFLIYSTIPGTDKLKVVSLYERFNFGRANKKHRNEKHKLL